GSRRGSWWTAGCGSARGFGCGGGGAGASASTGLGGGGGGAGCALISGFDGGGAGAGGAAAEGGGAATTGSGFGSGFGAGGAIAASGLASGFGRKGLSWVARVSGAIVTRSTAIGMSCGGGFRKKLRKPTTHRTNSAIWRPAESARPPRGIGSADEFSGFAEADGALRSTVIALIAALAPMSVPGRAARPGRRGGPAFRRLGD